MILFELYVLSLNIIVDIFITFLILFIFINF